MTVMYKNSLEFLYPINKILKKNMQNTTFYDFPYWSYKIILNRQKEPF